MISNLLFFSSVPTNIKQQKLLSADLEPNSIQVEAKWSPSSANLGHLRGYLGPPGGLLGGILVPPLLLQKRRKSMLVSLCASFASVYALLSLLKLPIRLQKLHC